MSSEFGKLLRISIFGQSHGAAVGVVMDGLPAGERIDWQEVQHFLRRRSPGQTELTSARSESDLPEILSGMLEQTTCGAPLCAVFRNQDVKSADYEQFRRYPRPSQADYPAFLRYHGFQDLRGGGHFSGRLTAPLCFAGAVALQILQRHGITIGGHIAAIGNAADQPLPPVLVTAEQLRQLQQQQLPFCDAAAGSAMLQQVRQAAAAGDSVGGVIEAAAVGLPGGWGNPMFDGIESRLGAVLFAIPAVRGVEFGSGFSAAKMRGSEHNDPWRMQEGKVVTAGNHHGGVLGGISTGMPLLVRVAFKPTASIARQQQTVDLQTGTDAVLTISGRHDPCIALRATPCVEAVLAAVLLDYLLADQGHQTEREGFLRQELR
ncbi:MAG: chorismate synthase [Negativicutes bacterium]|nr:chorismate synthase [Negativicutes bacterium]